MNTPNKMIVIKRIYDNKKLIADIGTVLNVVKDYDRIGGVEVLRKKSGKYVCDYGSLAEKNNCKIYNEI